MNGIDGVDGHTSEGRKNVLVERLEHVINAVDLSLSWSVWGVVKNPR
jgi:hypothetical protein